MANNDYGERHLNLDEHNNTAGMTFNHMSGGAQTNHGNLMDSTSIDHNKPIMSIVGSVSYKNAKNLILNIPVGRQQR